MTRVRFGRRGVTVGYGDDRLDVEADEPVVVLDRVDLFRLDLGGLRLGSFGCGQRANARTSLR